MNGRNILATYAAQVTAAIRTAFADRANFALQAGGMAVNNGFFLVLWFLFFAGFRQVGGWGLADVGLLLGLTMTIVGLAGVFFGGYRDMAATILRGELETLLTQPKPLIARLLARESHASGWGDLVTGVIMLTAVARLNWIDAPLVVLALAAGLIVYVSAAIAFASLAFWIAGARSFARDLTDFTLFFSTAPGSIYSGWAKLVAYSLLPAGFVVLAPVRLLRAPSLATFAVVAVSAAAYALIAATAFAIGLRRYRRGAAPIS